MLERAGQSSLAVPAGRVEVRSRPAVAALRTLDPWLERILRHGHGKCPAAHRDSDHAARARRVRVRADRQRTRRVSVLIALGGVEGALARGGRQAHELTPLRQASADPWLQAADDGTLEFSLAAALASLHDPHPTARAPALRDYLHGTALDERGQRSYGESHALIPRRSAPVARLARPRPSPSGRGAGRQQPGARLPLRARLSARGGRGARRRSGQGAAPDGAARRARATGLRRAPVRRAVPRAPRCPCRCSGCSCSRGTERRRCRSHRVAVGRLGSPPATSALCSGTRCCDSGSPGSSRSPTFEISSGAASKDLGWRPRCCCARARPTGRRSLKPSPNARPPSKKENHARSA